MKCPICGYESEGNEKFCTNCGAKFDGPQPAENTAAETKPEEPPAKPAPAPAAAPKPYVNTAAAAAPAVVVSKEKKKRELAPCKPLSTWGFIWRSIVFCIPVIGIIVMFVMAFAKGINDNSKSYARSCLIFLLIAVIILIVAAVLCYIFREPLLDWFQSFQNTLAGK
ncbi:MAG: hypothetical protein II072_01095 [Clostridia bacterium]|nr:hypothetical protein [Clostridia bacterium]MBQ2191683.1 hypothetical protein [Clostridia bacterium]MBQ3938978.1 hypothetical protein [Clostridia bacterium]MBQ5487665.1 hypothetical protein [Clostridia bacterium]